MVRGRPPSKNLYCPTHGKIRIRTREKVKFCPVCGIEAPKKAPKNTGEEWKPRIG